MNIGGSRNALYIRCAIDQIGGQYNSVLLVLSDQPLIPADHYRNLIKRSRDKPNKIVVTEYKIDLLGVPAIFPESFFRRLQMLYGDKGALSIVVEEKHRVER